MHVRPDAAVLTERRGNAAPVPPRPDNILNPQQCRTLRNIEGFGWRLAFVRRPNSRDPIPVVISPGRQRLAVLEVDGRVDMHPEIPFRR